MRQIGSLGKTHDARRLADYLLAQGIRTRLDELNGSVDVWVYEEDQVARATEELKRFESEPDHSRYIEAASAARAAERTERERLRQFRKNYHDMRGRWQSPLVRPQGISLLLLAASVLVTIATNFGDPLTAWFNRLDFSPLVLVGDRLVASLGVQPIADGEVWRLVTPIFIHMSLGHLVMNMMALMVLGPPIESRRGPWRLLGLTIVIAVASNLAEYFWSSTVLFGGMSGVLFGYAGYIWMKSRYEPEAGLFMPPSTITFMLIFLLLCFTGVLGNIANAAHTVGLASGMVIGVGPAIWRRLAR